LFCTHIGWRPLMSASALASLLHLLVSTCVPPLRGGRSPTHDARTLANMSLRHTWKAADVQRHALPLPIHAEGTCSRAVAAQGGGAQGAPSSNSGFSLHRTKKRRQQGTMHQPACMPAAIAGDGPHSRQLPTTSRQECPNQCGLTRWWWWSAQTTSRQDAARCADRSVMCVSGGGADV